MYEKRPTRKHVVMIFQNTIDKESSKSFQKDIKHNMIRKRKKNKTLNFLICSNTSTHQTQRTFRALEEFGAA